VQSGLALFGAADLRATPFDPDACMHCSPLSLFLCHQFAVRAGNILRDFSLGGGGMEELRDLREGTCLHLHAD
jgi:hypothetical protein